MKLNKIQATIIWISLSILIPATYFTVKEASVKNFQMKVWKGIENGDWKVTNGTVEQREINIRYMENKEDRNKAIETFGVFAFELLSLTGLLVYLTNKKND